MGSNVIDAVIEAVKTAKASNVVKALQQAGITDPRFTRSTNNQRNTENFILVDVDKDHNSYTGNTEYTNIITAATNINYDRNKTTTNVFAMFMDKTNNWVLVDAQYNIVYEKFPVAGEGIPIFEFVRKNPGSANMFNDIVDEYIHRHMFGYFVKTEHARLMRLEEKNNNKEESPIMPIEEMTVYDYFNEKINQPGENAIFQELVKDYIHKKIKRYFMQREYLEEFVPETNNV